MRAGAMIPFSRKLQLFRLQRYSTSLTETMQAKSPPKEKLYRNGMMIFIQKSFPKEMKHTKQKAFETIKILQKQYASLSATEKKIYIQKAKKNAKILGERKVLAAAKRCSPYTLFIKENFHKESKSLQESGIKKGGKTLQILSKQWKDLEQRKKEGYRERSEKIRALSKQGIRSKSN